MSIYWTRSKFNKKKFFCFLAEDFVIIIEGDDLRHTCVPRACRVFWRSLFLTFRLSLIFVGAFQCFFNAFSNVFESFFRGFQCFSMLFHCFSKLFQYFSMLFQWFWGRFNNAGRGGPHLAFSLFFQCFQCFQSFSMFFRCFFNVFSLFFKAFSLLS